MTRLAVLFVSAALLAAIPNGSAGPACAKRHWQQQSCVEQCKGKWGYPGLMMGSGPWGAVIQSAATDDWNSVIASACGSSTASAAIATATATAVGAIGSSPSSNNTTLSESTTQAIASSSSSVSSSVSSVTFATSSSSSSSFVPSTTAPAPAPTTTSSSSSEEQPSSTSTSVFTPQATTSTVEQAVASSSSTPAAAAASPAATSSSDSSSSSSSSSGSNGSGASDADVQSYLSAHNSVRAQHGASPLTWSNDAAAKAQQWANNCVFQHSGGTLGPLGENLAAGTGSGYGIPQAIQSWAGEVSQYNPSSPVASHFTQMVWKSSTQVGCAVQDCSGIFAASFGLAHFYVCEYSPQGNVIGDFAQNVQA